MRLGEYDGDLRQAVLETKYGRWRRQGSLLGQMLGERILHALEQDGVDPKRVAIVPVPMPAMRRFRRGIDHALVISRGVSAVTGGQLCPLLHRKGGPTQVAVAPSARANNIRGRITLRRPIPGGIETVVLVDDVRTTGATLDACCRALLGERKAKATRHGQEGPCPPWILVAVAATAADPARRSSSIRPVPDGVRES